MNSQFSKKEFQNQVCLLHGKTDLEEKNKILNNFLKNNLRASILGIVFGYWFTHSITRSVSCLGGARARTHSDFMATAP